MNVKNNKIITAALALIISATAGAGGITASASSDTEREFAGRLYGSETVQGENEFEGRLFGSEIAESEREFEDRQYGSDADRLPSAIEPYFQFDSSSLAGVPFADMAEGRRAALIDAWEIFLSLGSVKDKNVWSYQRKTVTIGGRTLSQKSVLINGVEYIPSRLAAEALGLGYKYTSSTKTVELSGRGLNMTFSNGCYVTYANGRALFSMTPSMILSDGRMYVPIDVFARAFGMKAEVKSGVVSLSGSFSPIAAAERFYRDDEVFWLARIIHAEAQGEPLLGQIAVGNVVLNRVRSAYYPNTIYGVIFDRKYGVQFSPTIDGSIYNNPSYNAVLAAKICLEGTDVSDGTFFFLRPEISSSSWIPTNRRYAFSIGKHDFYY